MSIAFRFCGPWLRVNHNPARSHIMMAVALNRVGKETRFECVLFVPTWCRGELASACHPGTCFLSRFVSVGR